MNRVNETYYWVLFPLFSCIAVLKLKSSNSCNRSIPKAAKIDGDSHWLLKTVQTVQQVLNELDFKLEITLQRTLFHHKCINLVSIPFFMGHN